MAAGSKGQKVSNNNGTTPGTDGTQTKYKFSGSPTSLFEHSPKVGEVRVMTITVECTSAGDEQIRDGVRHVANFAVREATLGRQTTLPETDGQTAIDDDEIADETAQAEQAMLGDDPDDATTDEDDDVVDAEVLDAADEDDAPKAANLSAVPDPFNPTGATGR